MGEDDIQSKCGLCVAHSLHDVHSFIRDLQHRGREACGIAAIGDRLDVMKWRGGVKSVDLEDLHSIFPAENYHTFMAHVRYATKGREDKILEDAHPHYVGGRVINYDNHILVRNCDAAIVHNGQINWEGIFSPEKTKDVCDTRLALDYYLQHGEHELMQKIPGSYVLAIADKKRSEVLVMRDRFGIKPGCLGEKDGKYCVASENIAFVDNGARIVEDLQQGSIYYLSDRGSFRKVAVMPPQKQHCFFEWNYIGNVDSTINEIGVRRIRTELGRAFAREFNPNDVDIITYLPRCPKIAALSYSKTVGKEDKFTKVFYKLNSERAFLGTNKADRKSSIKKNLYLHPRMEDLLKDKVVLVIDDSLIRGNNSGYASELLKKCNVKKVYYASYTPQIGRIGEDGVARGCMFGVDMPPEDDFIVRSENGLKNRAAEEINSILGMETYFMKPSGMFQAFQKAGISSKDLCSFCIGGKNPLN